MYLLLDSRPIQDTPLPGGRFLYRQDCFFFFAVTYDGEEPIPTKVGISPVRQKYCSLEFERRVELIVPRQFR